METVRYTYRLRPGAQALCVLNREAGMARWVWNRCVATDRDERAAGNRLSGYDMKRQLTGWRKEHAWLTEGSSVVQQETVLDWGRARTASFKVKGRRPPRFRSKRTDRPSLQYTRRGFALRDGRLVLAGGVSVPVVWSRDMPSAPTSVRVYQDTTGWWWASFVVRRPAAEPLPPTGRAIGIDWGVATIATATDPDFDLAHPEHGKRAAARLARYQRQMARRKPKPGQKASNGYAEAKNNIAKTYAKLTRQRKHTATQWAKRVVAEFGCIAIEDFHPKFLARSTMAKKALDATIGATKRELVYRAQRAGRTSALVPAPNTTTDCSGCGARTKPLTLSQRVYACPECGLVLPRDRNSARVVLARAGFDPAYVESVRHGSPPGGLAA